MIAKKKFGLLLLTAALVISACGQNNPNTTGDGQTTNGQTTNGQTTNGQTTNGQTTNGQTTNGQTTDGQPNNPIPTPQVAITGPAANSIINTPTFNLTGQISSNAELKSVQVFVNGVPVDMPAVIGPFNIQLNTPNTNGPFTVEVKATNVHDKVGVSKITLMSQLPATPMIEWLDPIELNDQGFAKINDANDHGYREIAAFNDNIQKVEQTTYLKGQVAAIFHSGGLKPIDKIEVSLVDSNKNPIINQIYAGPPNTEFVVDSTKVNNLEGERVALIVQIFFKDGDSDTLEEWFIADNTKPEAADPVVDGAPNPASRVLHDAIVQNQAIQDNNWGRGDLLVSTSNAGLKDGPVGPNKQPSGFEQLHACFVAADPQVDITVPGDGFTGLAQAYQDKILQETYPVPDANDQNAAAAKAVLANAKVCKTVASTQNANNYESMIRSVTELDDGTDYGIFLITQDAMGNAQISLDPERIAIDNTGPVIRPDSGRVSDISPVPLPSANPDRYVSDLVEVDPLVATDQDGVGFAFNNNGEVGQVDYCMIKEDIFSQGPGDLIVESLGGAPNQMDSNVISDGQCTVNVLDLEDRLGNPAQPYTSQTFVVDNTDPNAQPVQPPGGSSHPAGTLVNANANISDSTSGIRSATWFWNDRTHPLVTRASGAIAAPVQFGNTLVNSCSDTNLMGNIKNQGFNRPWFALISTPQVAIDTPQPMDLQVLAVDCAGNATFNGVSITVDPSTAVLNQPELGVYDAYPVTNPPFQLASVDPGRTLQGAVFNGTPVVDTLVNLYTRTFNIDLAVPGTFSTNNGGSINNISVYGEWALDINYDELHNNNPQVPHTNWTAVRAYQLQQDPSLNFQGGLMLKRQIWQEIVDHNANNQPITAPLLLIGNTNPSNNAHRAQSTVLNSFQSYGKFVEDASGTDIPRIRTKYSAFYTIAADNFGMFNWTGERHQP
ncbi:hypothetical protein HNR42_000861 [Deinobacterium chartae]|uniref:Uncharacterized protein n=1 Tax=Deinobacterium chartae TaxID=521158 RepID=A0A841HXR5_9DEIO|nr:Ig-like domain-containing protein [Deinobacterium chartae]MBB6097444.1 hypothetical protein [Deinobacterium chartae]